MPDLTQNNKTFLITGVMGSGKSELIKLIKKNNLGLTWVADDFVKKLYIDNSQVYKFIQENFPSAIINNVVSRVELGKKVFCDKNKLNKLNEFIQPIISDEISNYKKKEKKNVFVELKVYLDYASYYTNLFSWNLFLFSNDEVIEERIIKRFSHLDEKSLKNLIAINIRQQRNILETRNKLEQENWLFLENNSTVKKLEEKAINLIKQKLA